MTSRTLAEYRAQVVALLVRGRGLSRMRASALVTKHAAVVRAGWASRKPPCRTADALVARSSRDAESPRKGEVFEGKTSGVQWEVVEVDGKKVRMKRVGYRGAEEQLWSTASVRNMKPVKKRPLLERLFSVTPPEAPANDNARDAERRRRRRAKRRPKKRSRR